MSYYAQVQSILDTQLKTLPSLPSLQSENTYFTPSSDANWCRSTLLPSQSEVITLGQGGQRKDQGLYQIDIYVPQGDGAGVPNTIADQVIGTFVRGAYYGSDVRVLIENIYRLPANSVLKSAFYHIPVVVHWSLYDFG